AVKRPHLCVICMKSFELETQLETHHQLLHAPRKRTKNEGQETTKKESSMKKEPRPRGRQSKVEQQVKEAGLPISAKELASLGRLEYLEFLNSLPETQREIT
ncbi:hypothetical protein PFISCL1PPCAC_4417, partial [Pristionchus fissidentatus]